MKTEAILVNFLGAVLISVLLVELGCKPKEEKETQTAPPRKSSGPGNPKLPKLQAEIERLRTRPQERDPQRRPLVLSEKAGTAREWVLQVLRRGYAESGHTNTAWDASVQAAFVAYVEYTRSGATNRYPALTNAVAAARRASCTDPMIQYLDARYFEWDSTRSQEEFALAALRAQEAILDSRYHPLFKYLAGYRAVEAARTADIDGVRQVRLQWTAMALEDLVRDTNAPAEEVFKYVQTWVRFSNGKGWLDEVLSGLEPLLAQNWATQEEWFRLQGYVEIERAWQARGSDWANTVTEEGWRGFAQHLAKAEEMLGKAWQMNSNVYETAYHMMRVELGQGQGRDREELWFERAMALNTNAYDAAKFMSYYLEPRWHGSEDDCLEFARRCVTSKEWGGHVPLVLVDTHHSLAGYHKLAESPTYWQRPGVWQDVRASYERFFKLNPDAVGWRHNYARDAYLCGRYAEFLGQARLFEGHTNFAFFGGEQKFGEMVAKSAAASRKTK